jgi:hypothetical protein
MDGTPLQAAWLDLLGRYDWQWFATFTFLDHIHPEAADKRYRVWVSKLNRHLYGVKWYKRNQGVCWVRALEYQKRGVLHFHALLLHPTKDLNQIAMRFHWKDVWWQINKDKKTGRGRGIADIQKPADVAHVSRYVSKYVIKDGQIDVSPNLPYLNYQGKDSTPLTLGC